MTGEYSIQDSTGNSSAFAELQLLESETLKMEKHWIKKIILKQRIKKQP